MSWFKFKTLLIMYYAKLVSLLTKSDTDAHIYKYLLKKNRTSFKSRVYLQWLYVSAIRDGDYAAVANIYKKFGLDDSMSSSRMYIATIEALLWSNMFQLALEVFELFKTKRPNRSDLSYISALIDFREGLDLKDSFKIDGVPDSAVFPCVYYYFKAHNLDINNKPDALSYYRRCLKLMPASDFRHEDIVNRCNQIINDE